MARLYARLSVPLSLLFLTATPSSYLNAADSSVLTLDLDQSEQNTYSDATLDTDQISASVTMKVPSADFGKHADLFLVARHEGQWFENTESGWLDWSGDLQDLERTANEQILTSIDFPLFANEQFLAGDYEVWAGYQVAGEEIQATDTPATFTVHAADEDVLHPFRSDAAMEDYLKQSMSSSSSTSFNQAAFETFSVAESTDSSAAATRVSSTNIQETGVDEADVIKTDGEFLYVLRNCGFENCIATFELDAATPTAEEVGVYQPLTEVNDFSSSTGSMYLIEDSPTGNDLIVTLSGSNSYIAWLDVWGWGSNEVEIEFLDASEPADLRLSERMIIDGNLVSSRRIGDALYVVTRYTPGLQGFQPYAFDDEAQQSNQAILEEASLTSLTPKVEFPEQDPMDLIESKDCYITTNSLDDNFNPSIITVTTIPLADPASFSSTCFLGNTENSVYDHRCLVSGYDSKRLRNSEPRCALLRSRTSHIDSQV